MSEVDQLKDRIKELERQVAWLTDGIIEFLACDNPKTAEELRNRIKKNFEASK